jgi:hypothetical protein
MKLLLCGTAYSKPRFPVVAPRETCVHAVLKKSEYENAEKSITPIIHYIINILTVGHLGQQPQQISSIAPDCL